MIKQTKISYWLKGIAFVLAIMGLLFFGGCTYYININTEAQALVPSIPVFIFFLWYTAACCYLILFNFWSVCTEIGRDNSFSIENGKSFRHMAVCGLAIVIGYIVRTIVYALSGCLIGITLATIAARIVVILIFAIICEALSKLIYNAYEVKHENDLTI